MALCRQWLEALPRPEGVLEKIQRQGRKSLFYSGLPSSKIESWRLTDLKRLENLLKLSLSQETQNISQSNFFNLDKAANQGCRLILDPQLNLNESINLPSGFQKLNTTEIQQYLGRALNHFSSPNDWALAVNQASTNQILAFRVQGQDLPPLELIIPSQKDTLTPTRVIIILEEKVKLKLLQVALGAENSAQSHVLEIHLNKEAELDHGFVALGGGQASCLAHLAVAQEISSKYSLTAVQHGWMFSRLEPRIIQLNGQGSTNLKGLQISTGKQQLATHSLVRFEGPDGCLNQLQKAIANKSSHSIFNGLIEVPKIAQNTNASQLSRNLLLSRHARIDTKPELEIVADDVRCSHGATVSKLQEDELFYLRSRGIASSQATSLLLQGYCQEIIKDLPIEAQKWDILNTLIENINE